MGSYPIAPGTQRVNKRLKGGENLADLTIRQESEKIMGLAQGSTILILSKGRHTILKFGTYRTSIDDVETALREVFGMKRKSTAQTIIDQLKANGLKIRKKIRNSHEYKERILRVQKKKLVWTTTWLPKSEKLAGLTIKINNEENEMGQDGSRIKVIRKVKGQKKTTYDGTSISYNSEPYILEFEILEGKIGDVKVALEKLIERENVIQDLRTGKNRLKRSTSDTRSKRRGKRRAPRRRSATQ